MQTISTYKTRLGGARKIATLLSLIALLVGAWGCDDNTLTDADNNGGGEGKTHDPGKTDELGHGPDDGAEQIDVGPLTGDWRVELNEDNSLFVDVTLIQEAGSSEVDGYFTMSTTADNEAADVGGDLMEGSSFEGDTLVLKWNPTPDEDEVYTIEATREDADTLKGKVSALNFTAVNKDVTITRYEPVTDEEDEGSEDEEEEYFDNGPPASAGDP